MSTKSLFRPLSLLRQPTRLYSSSSSPFTPSLTLPTTNNRSQSQSPSPSQSRSPTSALHELFGKSELSDPSKESFLSSSLSSLTGAAEEGLKQQHRTEMYLRKHPRNWRAGDVYAPHDLSPAEAKKWRGVKAPKRDVIDMLGVNPLDNYRNFSMISEFMTPMGRIMHSKDTGLRPVNQRKMAKAIRRAIGLGIHPSVHRHPEVMKMRGRINTGMTGGF
ncbi:ribosomal protein S18 [Apiosordaria backusii]|uniref:Small ribosomal subunit protein bS18m n=1 Tax=Apiosordaria backusii TaxID=314023 RepID=A0AA40ETK7_9PEZI|nr:ribosomal protein S18 [Apiosordaria backusii]